MRTICISGLLLLVGVAVGQPESPVPEDVRANAVTTWRKAYDLQTGAIKGEIAKARQGMALFRRGSDDYRTAAGKRAFWEAELARTKKEPFCPTPRVGMPQLDEDSKVGAFGNLANPQGKVRLKGRDGMMTVEVSFTSTSIATGREHRTSISTIRSGTRTAWFRIVGPIPAGAITGRTIRLPDLYYVARKDEIAGKWITLLIPITVRPDEMPTGLATELEKKRKK